MLDSAPRIVDGTLVRLAILTALLGRAVTPAVARAFILCVVEICSTIKGILVRRERKNARALDYSLLDICSKLKIETFLLLLFSCQFFDDLSCA